MKTRLAAILVVMTATAACTSGGTPAATDSTAAAEGTAAAAAPAEGTAAAAEGTAAAAAEGTAAAAAPAEGTAAAAPTEAAADTFEGGVYTSPRFNVRFNLPEGWSRVEGTNDAGGPAGLGTSDDSITFVGPAETGLRLVVANSESIQLVDASFNNLTESIGFENVRIHPDRTQTRTFNGVPGYRTEADALLRGDAVPVYLIAQALELPGKPTMATIFVPGDLYHIHSATMFAILDSIQAINLRGN